MNITNSGIQYNNKTTVELQVLAPSCQAPCWSLRKEQKRMEPGAWWDDVRLYAFFSKSVPQFHAHVGQQSEAWAPSRFSSPIFVKFLAITESNKPEPASFHLIYKLPETFVIDPFRAWTIDETDDRKINRWQSMLCWLIGIGQSMTNR